MPGILFQRGGDCNYNLRPIVLVSLSTYGIEGVRHVLTCMPPQYGGFGVIHCLETPGRLQSVAIGVVYQNIRQGLTNR